MKLKHFLATLAVAAAPIAAHAGIFILDDFADPAGGAVLAQSNPGDAAISTGVIALTSPGLLATTRNITLDVTENTNALPNLFGADVVVGGGPLGVFSASNDNLVNSEVTLSWTIGAIVPALEDPASFAFEVVFADVGVPADPIELAFNFTGALGSFSLMATTGDATSVVRTFALAAGDAAIFSGGGTLDLVITGTPSWELTLDSVQIRIPEPGSLALVGVALLGAAAAVRRRAKKA